MTYVLQFYNASRHYLGWYDLNCRDTVRHSTDRDGFKVHDVLEHILICMIFKLPDTVRTGTIPKFLVWYDFKCDGTLRKCLAWYDFKFHGTLRNCLVW